MHPRLEEVLRDLDARRAALEQAVEAIPTELRERRPAPERWSVAEVLEHLALVEGQITKLLQSLIASAQAAGLDPEPETSPITPTPALARALDRSRPLVASEASTPRGGLSASAAYALLIQQREALRAVLLSADGLALSEVQAPNPVLGVLNGYEWVLFVGAHEARHTMQIHEIAASLPEVPGRVPLSCTPGAEQR